LRLFSFGGYDWRLRRWRLWFLALITATHEYFVAVFPKKITGFKRSELRIIVGFVYPLSPSFLKPQKKKKKKKKLSTPQKIQSKKKKK